MVDKLSFCNKKEDVKSSIISMKEWYYMVENDGKGIEYNLAI